MKRIVVAGAAVAATLAPISASARVTATAAAAVAPPVTVSLPAPTGHQQVGKVDLQLVDTSRRDPWVSSVRDRELMISVWYPARNVAKYPLAPQMLPGAAAHFGNTAAVQSYDVPPGTINWASTMTHAHTGAPVAGHNLPVVLYSPGLGDPRSWESTQVENLASHGYVVVTIDHTYEASEVEFPDGSVRDNTVALKALQAAKNPIDVIRKMMSVQLNDTEFVLDRLLAGTAGLPSDVDSAIDRHDIGMFGHSGGGFEALQLLHDDPRIRAGMDLDGILGWAENDTNPQLSALARDGIDKPYVLAGSATNDHYTSPSWSALWNDSHGWHRDVHLQGAEHASFTDAEPLISQAAKKTSLPAKATQGIGWIHPAEALAAQNTYITGFFDQWLRGRDTGVFDRPNPAEPRAALVR